MQPDTATQILRTMVAMFDTGETTHVDDVISADYLDHQGLGDGPMHGVDGFLTVVQASRRSFTEKRVFIEDIFGTDERAVARIRWQGTRADGTQLDRQTIDIVRAYEGRAVEHWGAHC